MSQTFSIVCHETKQKIWIGQGNGGRMTVFYSSMPDVMDRLARFLSAMKGKPLVLICNDTDGDVADHYEEFDDDEDG